MSIPKLEFPPFHLPAEAEALRGEVRSFLKETLPKVKSEDRFASWNTFSPEFSKALGKKGWIGITWPKQYGGSERSFLDRYVITEELLGNSAPAGAHWVADRQSGPLLLRFGNEEQRQGEDCEHNRIARPDLIQQCGQELHRGNGEEDAERNPGRGESHDTPDDETKDVAALRAEGQTDAQFMPALLDAL